LINLIVDKMLNFYKHENDFIKKYYKRTTYLNFIENNWKEYSIFFHFFLIHLEDYIFSIINSQFLNFNNII
jgi:hypothetical protein